MSHEQLNRNREIYALHKNWGKSYYELSELYGITQTRVRQICDQVRQEKLHRDADIPEIIQACADLNAPKYLNTRIQNCFRYYKVNIHSRWRKLTRKEILTFDNLGEKAADIIEYAQKL